MCREFQLGPFALALVAQAVYPSRSWYRKVGCRNVGNINVAAHGMSTA